LALKVNILTTTKFKGLLAIAYLALSSNVISLINYIQISYWLAIAGAIASLFYFRIKQPDLPRPIKVHISTPYHHSNKTNVMNV
jgi:membrane associated rhomboid family serine protease